MLISSIKQLFSKTALRDRYELIQARKLIRSAQYVQALSILDSIVDRNANNGDAWLNRGMLKRTIANPRDAIVDLVRAMELGAAVGSCYFEMSLCWSALGESAKALEHCEKARQVAPELVPAFFFLTQLRLPGEDYMAVIARIIDYLKPRTYVEIGIFEGASLRLAKSASAVVGIDPNPKIRGSLEPNTRVFRSTSDSFFENYDLNSELGQRSVDLAFIDGMHQFEYAMRDFANIERYCHHESVVLIHDCYPLDEESAGREPRATRWSGDVWRLIVLLKKYRPDLSIHTIGTAPTGLAVIQNLNPESTFLIDNMDRLHQEFLSLDYAYIRDDKAIKLNLFPNQWPKIKGMIRRRSIHH